MISSPAVTVQETTPIANTATTNRHSNKFRSAFGSMFPVARNSASEQSSYVEFGGTSEPDIATTDHRERTLGTFAGVFSPVALSMFSALVFIRVGFIVGNAGLYVTLLQFIIAYLILLFTVASVCAISTNGAIEGGGVYFMISRTLGLEFGGSIGSLFFLANVVGCAMAIVGCVEGILNNFGPSGYFIHEHSEIVLPDSAWWRFFYCTLINTCMLLVCLIGAALFAKTSVAILGMVTICLLATYISYLAEGPNSNIPRPSENSLINATTLNYTGLSMETLVENLYPHYGKDYTSQGRQVDFAVTFGVMFAGVTGIMAGANMSGELRNPAKSIPLGTLSAVGFTFVAYIILSFLMAFTTPAVTLQNSYLYLINVNIWPPFTTIGILTATFSTGLSNLIGSSRVLEALSKDMVFGKTLNYVIRGTWSGNPVAAVFTSWLLVECILLIGSFNIIAQVNSILFMLAYLSTNLACLCIELTGAPNFRPLFKYFTWHTCLIGLLATLIMMFVINAIYASLSIILCLLLVIALHLFSPATQAAQWGSISQALMFHQVRKYLLMLDPRKEHVKFWRPQMLLLVSSPRSCCPLVDFVNDLKKGGLYVLGHVQLGDYTNIKQDATVTKENQYWLSFIDHMHVKAFAEVTLARTIREGVQHLIRLSGIGAMKPNTIILGFYDETTPKDFFLSDNSTYKTNRMNTDALTHFPVRQDEQAKILQLREYVEILDDIVNMKKNLCICRHFQRLDKSFIARSKHLRYIDVWPSNLFYPKESDPFDVISQFMLQLATIINMLAKWKHLRLRIFLCEVPAPRYSRESFEIQSATLDHQPTTEMMFNKYKFQELLKSLRIEADIMELQAWSENIVFSLDPLATTDNFNKALDFMQNVNQIIRNYSDQTALSFIYLPKPPSTDVEDFEERAVQYMELLTKVTDELPPTVLVHGLSTVHSTTL